RSKAAAKPGSSMSGRASMAPASRRGRLSRGCSTSRARRVCMARGQPPRPRRVPPPSPVRRSGLEVALHRRPTMHLARFPRVRLAHLPTPLEPLPRLSEELGVELWIKRDDCTGLAGGGNKTRKLEFLLGEAFEQEADTLVTQGAVQSNHVRQTAAAAAA